MTDYKVIYRDFNGNELATITNWFNLEYARKKNEFGSLYLDLPPIYPSNFFKIDGILEVWRRVGAYQYTLDMDAIWFIRLIRYKTNEKGESLIHILAHDAISLLDRRIVLYAGGTPQASKTAPADDMIKAIVRENFGALATDAARDMSSRLDVEPDLGLCPSLSKEFHFLKILPLLQEICDASKTSGVDLSFDVLYKTPIQLQFKVYVGRRGTNRGLTATNPLTISQKNNALSYSSIAFDHTEEKNYIVAGGRGEKTSRILGTAFDEVRMKLSPWNRIEDFISSDSEDTPTADDEAKARLSEAIPKIAFNGHVAQTKSMLYGVHYFYGDTVVANYRNYSIDVEIDSIHIQVGGNGEESVTIFSRNLEDTNY